MHGESNNVLVRVYTGTLWYASNDFLTIYTSVVKNMGYYTYVWKWTENYDYLLRHTLNRQSDMLK